MPKSPQCVPETDRFPTRFSFNEITGVLDQANTTFNFMSHFRLTQLTFSTTVKSYLYPVNVYLRYLISDGLYKDHLIYSNLVTENFTHRFNQYYSIHKDNILWFDSPSPDGIKDVVIEVIRWSL